MLLLFYLPCICRNKLFHYYLKKPFYTFDNCYKFSKIKDKFFLYLLAGHAFFILLSAFLRTDSPLLYEQNSHLKNLMHREKNTSDVKKNYTPMYTYCCGIFLVKLILLSHVHFVFHSLSHTTELSLTNHSLLCIFTVDYSIQV